MVRNSNRKSIGRWIGEAIVISVSVLAAFYLDNLREERNQEKLFIQYLEDFRSDLEENQRKFEYELSNRYNSENGRGYLKGIIERLNFVDSVLAYPTKNNADTLIALIDNRSLIGVSEWIFVSPKYTRLDNEFYSYFKNDALHETIEMHYRNNVSRTKAKNAINQHLSDFQAVENQIDFDNPSTPKNRQVIFNTESKNILRRLKDSYQSLVFFTKNNKESDSLLIIRINKELELWN
ncbi:hypothetical protein [Roseivirga pacifica]|jgi:hypothetical protein|uniref:hypothetical protein n=1 Tax=Roseivirga pacifica TaxID=1267423 RepID=UPI003BAB0198